MTSIKLYSDGEPSSFPVPFEDVTQGDTTYILRNICAGEDISSDRNLVIIGRIGAGVTINSVKSVLISKAEEDHVELGSLGAGVVVNAGENLFLSSADAGCILRAENDIYIGPKIIFNLAIIPLTYVLTQRANLAMTKICNIVFFILRQLCAIRWVYLIFGRACPAVPLASFFIFCPMGTK